MIDSFLLGILILLQLGVVFVLWKRREGAGNEAEAALRQELAAGFARLNQDLRQELALSRKESAETAFREREERGQAAVHLTQTLSQQLGQLGAMQAERLDAFARELSRATQGLDERFVQLRSAVESRLQAIQADNAGKLEEMRRTVDEKLHATLEQRLGESFKLVSDRLDQVHRGLGEMQTLAIGVGDLKKVLTNVKTRGTWGEVQLGSLLEQILTVDQYDINVVTHPGSNDRVEFAIRLPGKEEGHPVWL
ncbi:MAG: DNA recombination protein RmuC, partial [Azovibrio sp.]